MPHRVPRYANKYPDGSGGPAWHTDKPEEAVRRACVDVSTQLHRSGSSYSVNGRQRKKVARRYITRERDGNYYIVVGRQNPGTNDPLSLAARRAPPRTAIVVWATDPFKVKVKERQWTGKRLGGEWSCDEEHARAEREEMRRLENDPSSPYYRGRRTKRR